MDKYFNYSHTIQPQDLKQTDKKAIHIQESDEDDMQKLFEIGSNKIQNAQQQNSERSYSSERSRQIKRKKIHKHKKHKHQKRQKKQKKQKKKSKYSKKYNVLDESSQSAIKETVAQHQQIVKYIQNKQIDKFDYSERFNNISKHTLNRMIKHQAILPSQTLQYKLQNKEFLLNEKIGQGLLLFSIIKIPDKSLFQYGLMEKDIPQYQRLRYFYRIIGMKSKKKAKKILRQLNRIINQKPDEAQMMQQKGQRSQFGKRYFDYKGYEDVGEKIQPKAVFKFQNIIPFQDTLNRLQSTYTSEQQSLRNISKHHNTKILQNPQNISNWLKFLSIQQKLLSLTVSQALLSKNKQTLLKVSANERKLAIIEKALTHNPFNERLGLQLLKIHLYTKKLTRKQTIQLIQPFMEKNPDSISLWKCFLQIQLLWSFQQFSHTKLKKIYEQCFKNLDKAVNYANSPSSISKLRSTLLQIIFCVVRLYQWEGFQQIATASVQCLIQYNFLLGEYQNQTQNLSKKTRQERFKQYWEDYEKFKIADLNIELEMDKKNLPCWQNHLNFEHFGCTSTYLSNYLPKLITNNKNNKNIQKEIQQTTRNWIPSHPKIDRQYIANNPESFIFYQDINHFIVHFKNQQNLKKCVDIYLQIMKFPKAFSKNYIDQPFWEEVVFQQVKSTFDNILTHKQKISQKSLISNFSGWMQFWNMEQTNSILNSTMISRLLHVWRTIATLIKVNSTQVEPIRSVLRNYLIFLEGCIYLTPSIRQQFKIEEQDKPLNDIKYLLSEDPFSPYVWSSYIQISYLKQKNDENCVKCYLQWIDSLTNIQIAQQNLDNENIGQAIMLLIMFAIRHGFQSKYQKIILYCIESYINRQKIQVLQNGFEISSKIQSYQLKGMDLLLFRQNIITKYKQQSQKYLLQLQYHRKNKLYVAETMKINLFHIYTIFLEFMLNCNKYAYLFEEISIENLIQNLLRTAVYEISGCEQLQNTFSLQIIYQLMTGNNLSQNIRLALKKQLIQSKMQLKLHDMSDSHKANTMKMFQKNTIFSLYYWVHNNEVWTKPLILYEDIIKNFIKQETQTILELDIASENKIAQHNSSILSAWIASLYPILIRIYTQTNSIDTTILIFGNMLKVAQKLVFEYEQGLSIDNLGYVIVLGKIYGLILEIIYRFNCSFALDCGIIKQFLFYLLDKVPFSRQLFLTYLKFYQTDSEKEKILSLMDDKGLRKTTYI